MNEPAGNQRQGLFLSFVRHCQWDQLLEAVGQGVSMDQRDLAVSPAVEHGQWWLVSYLVQLGVSQQQRDGAALAAARHQQWDCLHHLLSAGITTDSRDYVLREAARQSQWTLLTPLIPLGLKPESRELVVTQAVQDEQWDAVVDLLRLGLERNLVTQICFQIINKQQWTYVPSVMKLVNEPHMMDFVLQAAIRNCQWECVMQLIQIGLTPAQQQLVCHEALEFSHFDCAIELLRQGICNESACRIVLEALKWNQWQGLTDMLKESGICTDVRDAILKTAKQCMVDDNATDTVNVYMKLLEASGPTETELRNVIEEALYDLSLVRIFRQFLTVFKSARRLIKQTVLTITMSSADVILLHTLLWDQDPDLAFHLFVGQHMWECVVGIYEDPRLTARARRFALTQAISRQALTAVQQMTAMKVTSDRDRRHAFLQTSRLGEWHTALEISEQGVPLDCSDKVFALRMWASLGLWECVSHVFETWGPKQELVNCILQESIIAEQREVFVNVCTELDFENVNPAVVLKTALTHNKDFFTLEFCQCMGEEDILKMAIEFALKEENWGLVKDLIKKIKQIPWMSHYAEVSLGGLLLMCIKSIVQFQEAWPTVVPEVNTLCEQYFLDCEEDNCFEEIVHDFECVCEEGTHLLEFCLDLRHDYVALLLSVLSKNEGNVQRALGTVQQECLTSSVYQTLFLIAASNEDWGSSTLFLQYISEEQAVEFVVCDYMDGDVSDEFSLKCREKSLFRWATYICLWMGDWDSVRDDLEHHADINTVDKVIEKAADQDEWEIVLSYLSRCSQDQSLLCRILYSAVYSGQSECCEMLIVKVNPLLGFSGDPLLYEAVTSLGDREDMVKLCIKAGLSTHLEQWSRDGLSDGLIYYTSPMCRVLHNGQLPLVKLLYRAGACSNGELHEYKNEEGLKDQLTRQKRQDIMEYMDFMASTPRSLQDLCRQKVSHSIGCQPSRSERVSSLGLPHVVCDFINFADVLSS